MHIAALTPTPFSTSFLMPFSHDPRHLSSHTPTPTPAPQVSDILHNSTAPVRNASRYRSRLEEHLPDVFESLQVGLGWVGGRAPVGASSALAQRKLWADVARCRTVGV